MEPSRHGPTRTSIFLSVTVLRARARPCTADHARAAHHGQSPFALRRSETAYLRYRLAATVRLHFYPSFLFTHTDAHTCTRAPPFPLTHTDTHTRSMELARTATVKPQLETLSSPTRIASGWAHAKCGVLGRL
eukprot:IDg3758t1